MAELTDRVARPRPVASPEGMAASPDGGAAPTHAHVDPRAVRVRPAVADRRPDDPVLVVAPHAEPLRMTNPTVGIGPLGGVSASAGHASDEDAANGRGTDDAAGVRTQRQVLVDGEVREVELTPLGHGRHRLADGGAGALVILGPVRQGAGGVAVREVLVDGYRFDVEVESERIAALRERAGRGRAASAHSGPLEVRAIIPGRVVGVSVAPGDAVTAGQTLLVVEAMKMQNELRAPRDGTIDRVGIAPGVNIEVGDLLVVIS